MAIPLILQGIPRLLPLLAGSMYSASETDPQAIEYLMKLATSPVVSALKDTPSGTFSAPDLDEIEKEQERMRELNKQITLPSDDLSKILITPESEGLPSLISSPIPPEEKVSVDDIGFTPTPALKLEDMIMTAKNPEDVLRDERFKEVLEMAQGDPDVDYRVEDKKRGDFIKEAPQGNTFWTTAGFPGDRGKMAKSVIIHIKPGDYLKLAKTKEGEYNKKAFELYENANVGISIPKLFMSEDENGIFSVGGHEGRHRAKYFEGLDPDIAIPVQVQLTNKGNNEYVDYTRGYYTHGQSVLNAGQKLQQSSVIINENGNPVNIDVLGYQGDGKKVGDVDNPELKEKKSQKKNQLILPKGSMNDFFETSNEFESIEGRIEDMESRYYGGVGDLGDNQAAKTIQKIDGYDDYAIYIQEQAENFLGPEFKGFRITNTKEIMQLLNKQNKNKIKSFTLSPKQAVKFGYMANEAFMDPITTEPRGDLLIIESPIKSESLVMRGRPEEAEVISDTAKTSIKQSRIYDPYTGEVVYEPTEGPLVDTEPHNFETLIKTETEKSSFLDDLKERFTNKN